MAISDPSGGLLIQLEALPLVKPSRTRRLSLSDSQLKSVSELLSLTLEHAAPLMKGRDVSGAQAEGSLYRMVVPPHLQEALATGAANVMQDKASGGKMSAVQDEVTGRTIGQVRFQETGGTLGTASGVGSILPAVAVVASTAVLMAKLELIDRRLSQIGEQMDDIMNVHQDEANGRLLARVDTLNRYLMVLGAAPSLAELDMVRSGTDLAFEEARSHLKSRLLSLKRLTEGAPAFDSPALLKVLNKAAPQVQSLILAAVVMARAAAVASLIPEVTSFARGLESSREGAFAG